MNQSSKRILVVEDEASVRGLIDRILRREGYAIETASDGQEGLEKLRADDYDLVISDIVMPRMKGTEMVRELRKENEALPVIFVTGYPQDDSFSLGDRDKLLLKPFKQQDLNDMVHDALMDDCA